MKQLGYISLRNRYSPERIELSMEASGGNENVVCSMLKCTHREFQVLLTTDKELGKKWNEIRQSIVSEAEGVMATLLGSKSEQMRFQTAKYILDRRGTDLGYNPQGNSITVETKDGEVSIKSIFGIND